MKISFRLSLITRALGAALALLATACAPIATAITGGERNAVLAYSEPQADNLLTGLNSGDYAVFSRDFADQMKSSVNAQAFTQIQAQVTGKIGKYVSREVSTVLRSGNYITVIYGAKFEQEDGVVVRLVFEPSGSHRVTGLWFDSPKLRAQ